MVISESTAALIRKRYQNEEISASRLAESFKLPRYTVVLVLQNVTFSSRQNVNLYARYDVARRKAERAARSEEQYKEIRLRFSQGGITITDIIKEYKLKRPVVVGILTGSGTDDNLISHYNIDK